MAAAGLTLRSTPSVTVDDQAKKLADSNPSVKIGSIIGVGVNVGVSDGPSVAVGVGVAEEAGVNDGVLVDVNEAIGDGVWLAVSVVVGLTVDDPVGVLVGVFTDGVFVAVGPAGALVMRTS